MTFPAAEDISHLERSEHLVLFGFRVLAVGRGDCPLLQGVYGEYLGSGFDETLCSLLALVRSIAWCGCRRVRLYVPGCAAVSDDERTIIATVAAAQASLFDGVESKLSDTLARLLGTSPSESCLMAAQALAATLICGGIHLPQRTAPTLAVRSANSQTVH